MQNKYLKIYLKVHIFFVFCLIALGGAVRAMNAGLACPDWPLCFGQVIPDYQLQVYYEFIHRALAGIETILTVALMIYLLRGNFEKRVKYTISFSVATLIAQIVFGALTVLKLLHSVVVTTHLALAMTFLCSLLWLYFQLFEEPRTVQERVPRSFQSVLWVVFAMIFMQILLGGLVSSNYAGLACEGFPLCNGFLIPTMKGIVGLQVQHRLWGYLTALGVLAFAQVIWKNKKQNWMDKRILKFGSILAGLILLQIVVGAMNVIYKTPAVITVIHLAIAATLLGLMLRIFYVGTR